MLFYAVFADCISIIIHKEHGLIKWRSVFRPFGVTIQKEELIAYVQIMHRSKFEQRPILYLIGKNNQTILKISGFKCENIDELIDALDLPKGRKYTTSFFEDKVYLID